VSISPPLTPFALAVDATFDHLSVGAIYTPRNGPTLTVRVMFKEPTEVAGLFDAGLSAPAYAAEVRASEVAAPGQGDRLTVGGRTYSVREARQDALGLVWRLDLDPAS